MPEILEKPRTIHRLQDKCPVCDKVAKVKSKQDIPGFILYTFECGHVQFVTSTSTSKFENLIFDGLETCKHNWTSISKNGAKTLCKSCGAKRLFQFQIEGARFLERANGRAGLLDVMGLGKTIEALAYMKYNMASCSPYLWVTKSKIKYQHAREILRLLGPENFPYILTNGKSTFIEGFRGYLMSYDLFRRLDLEMIKAAGINTLVLDECQAIKNPDSARTIAIREVAKHIPRIIPMSGTPWKNKGSELFVALNLLDPKMFWSPKAFKSQWIREYVDSYGKVREGGILNPERFREQTSHILIRREKKDVQEQLPYIGTNRTKLFCEVPEHARNVYNDEVLKIKNIMKDAAIDGTEDTFAVQSQLQQSVITMKQIVGLAKVPTIVEYLEEFMDSCEDKIICFIHHVKVGELIYEQMCTFCKDNGLPKPIRMLGGTSAEDSMRIQTEFNDGPTRLLVASTLSAGEGLNLQKHCNTVLIGERQWNPANEEQAEDRVNRIGQEKNGVNAIYALADKTVDTFLDIMVENKRREFENSHNKEGYKMIWNEAGMFKDMIKAILAA